jgi:hypothetical protein
MLAVVEQLSGVRLLQVAGDSLRLSITTRAPATQGDKGPSAASSRKPGCSSLRLASC